MATDVSLGPFVSQFVRCETPCPVCLGERGLVVISLWRTTLRCTLCMPSDANQAKPALWDAKYYVRKPVPKKKIAAPKIEPLRCADCGLVRLGPKNQTGYCASCIHSHPEARKKAA
jgi:hypothetical protein